jgi:hypothetical protein
VVCPPGGVDWGGNRGGCWNANGNGNGTRVMVYCILNGIEWN